MKINKLVLIVAASAVLLSWQYLEIETKADTGGIDCPCSSTAEFLYPTGTRILIVCPQGDGPSLEDGNNQILVYLNQNCCCPVEGADPDYFYMIGRDGSYTLCGGQASAYADSATNAGGYTTLSGSMAAGGSSTGLFVTYGGYILSGPCPPTGLAITVVSPDIDADLDVDLVDFTLFAPNFPSPPNAYDWTHDYDADYDIDLVDFAIFARHWQHHC